MDSALSTVLCNAFRSVHFKLFKQFGLWFFHNFSTTHGPSQISALFVVQKPKQFSPAVTMFNIKCYLYYGPLLHAEKSKIHLSILHAHFNAMVRFRLYQYQISISLLLRGLQFKNCWFRLKLDRIYILELCSFFMQFLCISVTLQALCNHS